MPQPDFLKRKGGAAIAYHRTPGDSPGVVFLGGFRSDMTGAKATALEAFCIARGQAFVRFDYQGHGRSTGVFEECGIGLWKDDALAVLTKLTTGKQILIGSSMGGWLALLLAMEKPRRVAGLVGIAAAPDFTEQLLLPKLSETQRADLARDGRIRVQSTPADSYAITREFLDDARAHCILSYPELPIYCPVRLLHGMKDTDVPWEFSLSLNEKIAGQDVKTLLIENGDHRLSAPEDIAKLLRATAKLSDSILGK